MNENDKLNDLYNSNNDNNAKKPNVLENEYMALVNIILSAIVRINYLMHRLVHL